MRGLVVAGRSGSSAGTRRWPGITACTPTSMAARKGTSSRQRSTSALVATVGNAWCESTAVSP